MCADQGNRHSPRDSGSFRRRCVVRGRRDVQVRNFRRGTDDNGSRGHWCDHRAGAYHSTTHRGRRDCSGHGNSTRLPRCRSRIRNQPRTEHEDRRIHGAAQRSRYSRRIDAHRNSERTRCRRRSDQDLPVRRSRRAELHQGAQASFSACALHRIGRRGPGDGDRIHSCRSGRSRHPGTIDPAGGRSAPGSKLDSRTGGQISRTGPAAAAPGPTRR